MVLRSNMHKYLITYTRVTKAAGFKYEVVLRLQCPQRLQWPPSLPELYLKAMVFYRDGMVNLTGEISATGEISVTR